VGLLTLFFLGGADWLDFHWPCEMVAKFTENCCIASLSAEHGWSLQGSQAGIRRLFWPNLTTLCGVQANHADICSVWILRDSAR